MSDFVTAYDRFYKVLVTGVISVYYIFALSAFPTAFPFLAILVKVITWKRRAVKQEVRKAYFIERVVERYTECLNKARYRCPDAVASVTTFVGFVTSTPFRKVVMAKKSSICKP